MPETYITEKLVLPPIEKDKDGFPTEESIMARTTPANTSRVFPVESMHGGHNDGDANGLIVC